MAEYTLTLSSDEDYRLIRKILKAFDGASIRPNDRYTIEDAYEEVNSGKIKGPIHSTSDLMADLLK